MMIGTIGKTEQFDVIYLITCLGALLNSGRIMQSLEVR